MEWTKNAMYSQAGRTPWTQASDNIVQIPVASTKPAAPVMPTVPVVPAPAASKPAAPVTPAVPVVPAPAASRPAMPVMPAVPAMPAPPVIKPPEMSMPGEMCTMLAMATMPMQKWHELYETDQGFSRGTIFAELDLPFLGEGACKHE